MRRSRFNLDYRAYKVTIAEKEGLNSHALLEPILVFAGSVIVGVLLLVPALLMSAGNVGADVIRAGKRIATELRTAYRY